MKRVATLLALSTLLACQPPWEAPHAHIQTLAYDNQEAFEFIKTFHDKKFSDDHMNLVYQASIIEKQQNGLGSIESWIIGTEKGNRYKYIIQTAIYYESLHSDGIHGHYAYAVLKYQQISKL